jgi:hypothetical protein
MENVPAGTQRYELHEKTALVIDNGLFFEFALHLAKSFKKVFYFCEFRDAFPGIDKAAVGNEYVNGHEIHSFDGLPVHRITSIYEVLDRVDIAIFPDVGNGDLAEYLRAQGLPVFGSGKGELLELWRVRTKALLKEHGLPVHDYEMVTGTIALREALSKNESLYVKISRYRGVFETYHHTSPEQSDIWINDIEQRLGKLADVVDFLIEQPLEAKVEIGTDSYTMDGLYPSTTLTGTEIKDLGYCGMVFNNADMPKGARTVDEGLCAIFKEFGYRGFYSTEIRETENGDPHMVDFTARMPLPPGFLYGMMYHNLAEIVWGIANGEMVEPVIAKKFGMMVMLNSPWYKERMLHVKFPAEYRSNIQLLLPVKIEGEYYCISQYNMEEFGAVSVVGDTIDECMQQAEKILSSIEAHQFGYDEHVLEKATAAFQEMTKAG